MRQVSAEQQISRPCFGHSPRIEYDAVERLITLVYYALRSETGCRSYPYSRIRRSRRARGLSWPSLRRPAI
jgi:hypothetical protein